MSHHLLLVNADESATFQREQVMEAVKTIPGFEMSSPSSFQGCAIRGEFKYQDDSTFFELSDDDTRISLSGTGIAALAFALVFQRRITEPLRAFDSSYTFDVCLNDVHDLGNFQSIAK